MIMQQQQTNEELCNLFIQSLEAKDEKTILKILECDDEATIKDVINRIPAHHVRKLVLELRNILSQHLTTNHLTWLQHVLALKFSALASMADNRSIVMPLVSLLDDRSSPAYYMKMQALRGKINLLKQLKQSRDSEVQETVVRVPVDRGDQPAHMEVEESDTDSEEEDFDDEEQNGGEAIELDEDELRPVKDKDGDDDDNKGSEFEEDDNEDQSDEDI